LNVIGGCFERNVANGTGSYDYGGGGLYIRGNASLTETQVVSNTAGWLGGGLYIYENATLILSGTQVISNTAGRRGGGLFQYIGGGRVDVTGGHFEGNVANGTTSQYDGGGGLYIWGSAVLTGTQVISNTAARCGGGLYQYDNSRRVDVTNGRFAGNRANGTDLWDGGGGLGARGSVALTETEVVSNTAASLGGGLYQITGGGQVDVTTSRFEGNVATNNGGGLYLRGTAVLTGTQVVSNTAGTSGGGLYQYETSRRVDVTGGSFEGNVAGGTALSEGGGGLYIRGSATLTGTQVISNTAGQYGGGLYGMRAVDAVNDLFAANTAPDGAGLYLEGAAGNQTLRHLTVVSPTLDTGSAIYVAGGTVNVTNTIIASYTVGIRQTGGTLNEDYNLYFGNGTDINSTGGTLVTGANSLHGLAPRFVDSDYHIGTDSAALDAGAFLGVTDDIDGDARPTNSAQPDAPDIGCDENKSLTVQRTVTDTMTFGAAGARIVFTDTGFLSTITITVVPGQFPTENLSDQVVSRTIVITPSSGVEVSATLTLCYEDSEVKDGLEEASLQLYRRADGGWEGYPSTVDTDNNVVTASGVAAFSSWLIGDKDNPPTAVRLVAFEARSARQALVLPWWALVGVAVAVLLFGWRRQ
jgi:predicted outer membrane repeat protein